jgi:2-C-methyl-D-erythritol 4-phosphate cytidylyltransferase
MSDYKTFFLIVAAGQGMRMGSEIKKQYLPLGKLPILSHTLLKFSEYSLPNVIVLVVPEQDIDYCRQKILKPVGLEKRVCLVPGGKERQESVFNGINKIKNMSDSFDRDILLIHDGVRPFIDANLIDACVKGAIKFSACVPGIKIVDTIKSVSDNSVLKTLDREVVYQIQTPQAFSLKIIIDAMNHAIEQDFSGTDDASLVEFLGHKVAIINGLRRNIKITTKEDIEFAKAFLTFT